MNALKQLWADIKLMSVQLWQQRWLWAAAATFGLAAAWYDPAALPPLSEVTRVLLGRAALAAAMLSGYMLHRAKTTSKQSKLDARLDALIHRVKIAEPEESW